MRTATVNIAGKNITIREKKIRYFREELLPQLAPALDGLTKSYVQEPATEEGQDPSSSFVNVFDYLGEKIPELFPELQGVDLLDCYPSEIEAFGRAWIDVNFTGIKSLFGPLLSLAKAGDFKLQ